MTIPADVAPFLTSLPGGLVGLVVGFVAYRVVVAVAPTGKSPWLCAFLCTFGGLSGWILTYYVMLGRGLV